MNWLISTKLVIKIAVLYLFFIVLAFCLSVAILYLKTEDSIDKSVEHSFAHKREQIVDQLINGEFVETFRDTKINKIAYQEGSLLKTNYDTVMLDEAKTEHHLYRLSEEIILVNGSNIC